MTMGTEEWVETPQIQFSLLAMRWEIDSGKSPVIWSDRGQANLYGPSVKLIHLDVPYNDTTPASHRYQCYHMYMDTNQDLTVFSYHDDVIKWKHFPRNWPFVRGIHRSPVNSPHKGQWRGALMFTLICARINGWVNNREAGDLRRYRAHYDVIVMLI